MTKIIPTPKSATFGDGTTPLRTGDGIDTQAAAARPAAEWLRDQLQEHRNIGCFLTPEAPTATVVFALGVAQEEQAYELTVDESGAVIIARDSAGFFHGAASLLQLVSPGGVQFARVVDSPDFEFRVADWLLNVEANRWGYERGDGRAATVDRLRRKIDQAARYKLNVIWFDGFGWSVERSPGYAEAARDLARYARSRGIRLAHAGYGGGYGFAYQTSELYSAPYMGEVFENRRPYPDGPIYDCVGEPSYATSWRYGTCVSNEGLAEAKLIELVRFVETCEPGMLYVHDVDIGGWGTGIEGWRRRCDACRERWPSDDLAAEDGMAGAYATWFRALAAAVNAARSEDGEYVAARDCEIVFVGPVYTGAEEADELWDAECVYFERLSRAMGPAPNVQFGIREQLVSDRSPRLRVAELSDRLRAVGNGHGVFVCAFVGGDSYYSDQLVAPSATLNTHFAGARTIYSVNTGSVSEPAQLVAAEYAWNASAPGAAPIASSHGEASALLEASRSGDLRPDALYEDLLSRICRQLYGATAGPIMAEVFAPRPPQRRPVPVVWHAITRELARLRAGDPGDANFWRSRAQASEDAATLVEQARSCGGVSPGAREDLAWLARCLSVGRLFCEALAEHYAGSSDRERTLTEIDRLIPERSDHLDPIAGDIGVWRETLAALRSLID